jgi:polyisoprenoid-binding protein YceI
MKKIALIVIAIMLCTIPFYGQHFITKNGHISFYSDGPLEKIEAHNKQVNSAINIETGDIVFKVLMKSFIFEKALMQEHFNENYVESDKFPNATFKGKIMNLSDITFNKNGTYNADIEGELKIHGITQTIKEKGTFKVSNEGIHGNSSFNILLADYEISIPGAVTGKIAEEIAITIDVKLKRVSK